MLVGVLPVLSAKLVTAGLRTRPPHAPARALRPVKLSALVFPLSRAPSIVFEQKSHEELEKLLGHRRYLLLATSTPYGLACNSAALLGESLYVPHSRGKSPKRRAGPFRTARTV